MRQTLKHGTQRNGSLPSKRVSPQESKIEVHTCCRASMEEIQALGPKRAKAFLMGVGEIMATSGMDAIFGQGPVIKTDGEEKA